MHSMEWHHMNLSDIVSNKKKSGTETKTKKDFIDNVEKIRNFLPFSLEMRLDSLIEQLKNSE